VQERSWEVQPGVGAGPLRFGTPRAELRATLGPYEAFRRSDTSDLTDQYESELLMLTCSDDEGLYLIEIPDPDGVHFRGVPLAGEAGTVLAALRAAGVEATAADSGWNLADGAISLSATSRDPDEPIKAVTVFGPGHETGGEIVFFPAGADAAPPAGTHVVSPGNGVAPVRLGEPRDDVRRRCNGGVCWQYPAGSREPVEDTFFQEGLVVRYGADLRVERIFVTKAEAVLLDGVNLMPAHPATVADVRSALERAGHEVTGSEAAIAIAGTGVQVLTRRPSTSGYGPMPVSCVAVGTPTA
jgi:hypothetical protein